MNVAPRSATVLAALTLLLVGCSNDTGSAQSAGTPSAGTSATAASGASSPGEDKAAACQALDQAKSAATRLKQDFDQRNPAAMRSDVNALQQSMTQFLAAGGRMADQRVADVEAAWKGFQATVQNLGSTPPNQMKQELQTALQDLDSSLSRIGSSLDCP